MSVLYVQLSGGLGNQMFQYATSRALSLNSGVGLQVDAWSGFIRDQQYKRAYQLNRFPATLQYANGVARASLWTHRLFNRFLKKSSAFYEKHWYGNFYTEIDFKFESSLASANFQQHTWLLGYWQSPRYFEMHEPLLQQELMPPNPSHKNFLELGQKIRSCESVAVGIRLYEESSHPASHALHGKVKTIEDVNTALEKLYAERPAAKVFVFCTHRSPLLQKINLPTQSTFVTPDDGYEDALNCLWLMAQCKHHLFMNSSYYWWGAWLSQAVYQKENQLIYAADNFINIDGICQHWRRF
jgi:hypothetical protein